MTAKFTHLGAVLVPLYPVSSGSERIIGVYMHDYLVECDGQVDYIRDKDYLPDGEYQVGEDFWDTVTPRDEQEDVA